jgi:hypothetical protein
LTPTNQKGSIGTYTSNFPLLSTFASFLQCPGLENEWMFLLILLYDLHFLTYIIIGESRASLNASQERLDAEFLFPVASLSCVPLGLLQAAKLSLIAFHVPGSPSLHLQGSKHPHSWLFMKVGDVARGYSKT